MHDQVSINPDNVINAQSDPNTIGTQGILITADLPLNKPQSLLSKKSTMREDILEGHAPISSNKDTSKSLAIEAREEISCYRPISKKCSIRDLLNDSASDHDSGFQADNNGLSRDNISRKMSEAQRNCDEVDVSTSDSSVDSAQEEFMSMDWLLPDAPTVRDNASDCDSTESPVPPNTSDAGSLDTPNTHSCGLLPVEWSSITYQLKSSPSEAQQTPIDWSALYHKAPAPPIARDLERLTRKRKYGSDKPIAPPQKYGNLRETFQGNINYARLYNRHVRESVGWCETARNVRSCGLYDSRMSVNLDTNPKEGERWTVDEKLTFFKALSRYSIHRLDDIKAHLPNKSEGLVLLYYCKLRDQLRAIKQDRKRHYLRIVYSFKDESNTLHTERKNVHYYEDGVLYSLMPIAYEMSEPFIKFEEKQAELLQRDQGASAPRKKRYQGPLLDPTGMKSLSAGFLDRNRIVPGKSPHQMENDASVLMEDLTVLLLRKIILKIITDKQWSRTSKTVENQSSEDQEVTNLDVYRALSRMRYAPENDHVFSWNHMWAKMPERLKLLVNDTAKGGPMTHQEVETYILFHSNMERSADSYGQMYLDKWQVCGPNAVPCPAFTSTDIEGENLIDEEEEGNGQPTIENSETNVKPQIISIDEAFKQRKRAHYNSEKEHEDFSLQMLNLETEKLEVQDRANSAIYEHALLTTMATKASDHALDTYSVPEAIEILHEWDEASESSSDDESQRELARAQYVAKRKRVRIEKYKILESDTEVEYLEEDDPVAVPQKYTFKDEKRRLENMDNDYAYYSVYDT